MTNPQFNKLAGNTVADLVAWLQQFPQDYTVQVPVKDNNSNNYYSGSSHELISDWEVLAHAELKTIFLGEAI